MTEFDQCLAGALPDDVGSSFEERPINELPLEPLEEGIDGFEPSPDDIEALDAEFEAALQECQSQFDASGSATVSEGPGAEEELFFHGEGTCEHLVPEDTES